MEITKIESMLNEYDSAKAAYEVAYKNVQEHDYATYEDRVAEDTYNGLVRKMGKNAPEAFRALLAAVRTLKWIAESGERVSGDELRSQAQIAIEKLED